MTDNRFEKKLHVGQLYVTSFEDFMSKFKRLFKKVAGQILSIFWASDHKRWRDLDKQFEFNY